MKPTHFASHQSFTLCGKNLESIPYTSLEGNVTCEKCLSAIADIKEQHTLLTEGETTAHQHKYKLTKPPFYACECGLELALITCTDGRRRFRRLKGSKP